MKKQSTHRGSSISIGSQKSNNNQNPTNEDNTFNRSHSNNKMSQHSQPSWTPERVGNNNVGGGNSSSFMGSKSSQTLMQAKFNQVAQMLGSSSVASGIMQSSQSRSPLVKDTVNTTLHLGQDTSSSSHHQHQQDRQNKQFNDQSHSISPMRLQATHYQQQNIQSISDLSNNISRNQSHRNSSSTSMINMIKTVSEKEKDKKYIEKVKLLKAENKKLKTLLKESERLFYQKLQETKKESQNLSNLFKQLWPLIKNKVKDPTLLLKTVNGINEESNQEGIEMAKAEKQAQIDDLQQKLYQLKKKDKQMREEFEIEQRRRVKAEGKAASLSYKLQELTAFQQTMQSFMADSSKDINFNGFTNKSITGTTNKVVRSTDNSTKPSSTLRQEREEPIPSFLKAMAYQTLEDLSCKEAVSDGNEDKLDSVGSEFIDDIQRRFSDISITKSASKVNRQQSTGVISDNTPLVSNDLLIIESFGEHSVSKSQYQAKELSFGNKKLNDMKQSSSLSQTQVQNQQMQHHKQQKKSDGNLLKSTFNQTSQILQSNEENLANLLKQNSFLQASQGKGNATQRQITSDELNLYKMLIQSNMNQENSRKSQVLQSSSNNNQNNILKSFLIAQPQQSKTHRQMSPF